MKRRAEFLAAAALMVVGAAVAVGVYGTGESRAAEVPIVGITNEVQGTQQSQQSVQETQEPEQGAQQQETEAAQQDAGGTTEITEDSVYWPVIAQYREAAANNMYAELFESGDWSAKGEFVNMELLNNSRNFDESMPFHVYYAVYDINQDGTEEFFIGAGVDAENVNLYDMFTNDGQQIIPLFEVGMFGYRSSLNVYADDSFAVYASGGAATNSLSYYTLPAQGTEPVLSEEYGMLDGACYHKDETGATLELSQEEYYEKEGQFWQNRKAFQWNEI